MSTCVGRSLGYLQSRSNCFDAMIESPGNVGSEAGSRSLLPFRTNAAHQLERNSRAEDSNLVMPRRHLSQPIQILERFQGVSAAVSRLRSDSLSIDFTSSMTDSVFSDGHLANSALPLNLSATSS